LPAVIGVTIISAKTPGKKKRKFIDPANMDLPIKPGDDFFLYANGSWSDDDSKMELPADENATFVLQVDDISIGLLHCENGEWLFKYTKEFKSHSKEYNRIVGFPDLDKEYRSDSLWPFFRIRIPGLKQPAVQEILKKEKIDQSNEVALLKRFGQKTITDPYQLVAE
jgi:HipA-like protein